MAIISGTTSNSDIICEVGWAANPSVEDNTSTVGATLYYKKQTPGVITGNGAFSLRVGLYTAEANKAVTISSDFWTPVLTCSAVIAHDENGDASARIIAGGSVDGSFTSTILVGNVTLPTIERTSSITYLSALIAGSDVLVRWVPKSTAFSYEVEVRVGDTSYKTPAIYPSSTKAYEYKFTMPYELAEAFPNSARANCEVLLHTYNGSTELGYVAQSATITLPNNNETKPSIGEWHIEPIDIGLPAIFGGLYIQSKTPIAVTRSESIAKYGATVVTDEIIADGVVIKGNENIQATKSTTVITRSVIDSRGFRATETRTINIQPYLPPKIIPAEGESRVRAFRCDADGIPTVAGTSAMIKAGIEWSTITAGDGDSINSATLKARIKKTSDQVYGQWHDYSEGVMFLDDLTESVAYLIELQAKDTLGSTTTLTLALDSGKVYLHKAGSINSLGIGRRASNSNSIEIDDSINVNGIFMKTVPIVSGKIDVKTEDPATFFVAAPNCIGVARVDSGVASWQGTTGVTVAYTNSNLTINLNVNSGSAIIFADQIINAGG